MRLFTGIDLPEPLQAALAALIDEFRPLAPSQRWSVAANLHVTAKFIGEWPQARLDELRQALSDVPAPPAFSISLDGIGWFPNPHQPRIFWAAVKAGPELANLAAAIETRLEKLGIAREDRPYRPHLTLARVAGGPAELTALRQAVAALPSTSFGSFDVKAYHLYVSEAGRYTKLATFRPSGEGCGE